MSRAPWFSALDRTPVTIPVSLCLPDLDEVPYDSYPMCVDVEGWVADVVFGPDDFVKVTDIRRAATSEERPA